MIFAIVIWYGFICLLNYVLFRKVFRINFLLTSMWCFALLYCQFSSVGLYPVSEDVKMYAFVFLVTYNVLYYLFSRTTQRINPYQIENNTASIGYISKKMIRNMIVLNIICWIAAFPILLKSISIISLYGFAHLRIYAFDSRRGLATTSQLLLCQYIMFPFFNITFLLAVMGVLLKKKGSLRLAFVGLISAVYYVLLFGGRATILQILYYILLTSVVIYRRAISSILKKHKLLILFIILLLPLIINVSSTRTLGKLSILQTMAVYYSGPFVFLSRLIENGSVPFGILHGRGFFGFIYDPIVLAVRYAGIHLEMGAQIITDITAPSVRIADDYSFNAAGSSLLVCLMEGGFIGVIIGGIIVAFITSFSEKLFFKSPNLRNLCLYVYILYLVILSTDEYSFYHASTLFCILFILFVLKKSNISDSGFT